MERELAERGAPKALFSSFSSIHWGACFESHFTDVETETQRVCGDLTEPHQEAARPISSLSSTSLGLWARAGLC